VFSKGSRRSFGQYFGFQGQAPRK